MQAPSPDRVAGLPHLHIARGWATNPLRAVGLAEGASKFQPCRRRRMPGIAAGAHYGQKVADRPE